MENPDRSFAEISYQRINFDQLTTSWRKSLQHFQVSENIEEQVEVIQAINALRNKFQSSAVYVEIRNTMDTGDEFYAVEQDYFDNLQPHFEQLMLEFYAALVESVFAEELEHRYGSQFMRIAGLKSKTMHKKLTDLLTEENKLSSSYTRIVAAAKIKNPEYTGVDKDQPEYLTLSEVSRKSNSADRLERARYTALRANFYHSIQEKLDTLFDRLVHTRNTISQIMNCKSFTEMGYSRMLRTSYTPEMVSNFRQQVQKYIVPLVSQIRKKQREIMNLPAVMIYDEDIPFDARPISAGGDGPWLIKTFAEIFSNLSPETGKFYEEMQRRVCYDIDIRPGKIVGAYSNYIPDEKFPFVFLTYNQTARSVRTFAHECGHAFQSYVCRDKPVLEHVQPTSDIAEIHSMSMEFFIWPFADIIFGDAAETYRQNHLVQALTFIPYGTAVDEFQHRIYDNPDMTPQQRRELWKSLEAVYLPDRNYGDLAAFTEGGFWHQQTHIFKWPFYYIDYVLAQVCALQMLEKINQDQASAWKSYTALCEAGGTCTFFEALDFAGLVNPFEPHTLDQTAHIVKSLLGFLIVDSDTEIGEST
ncbi:MAG: M3 family oligoendopeptidase [Bacteroidetes bacterium]|nr:M3 family oligoendopeptidase [Bacteroidota bacterium]